MSEIFQKENSLFDIDFKTKRDVIYELAKKLKSGGRITDTDLFFADVLAREELSSTVVGNEIAIPHGKTKNVIKPSICFVRLLNPIVWNEETGEEAKIVILIAVPESDEGSTHIEILSKLARKLVHQSFYEKLLSCNKEEIEKILKNTLED
jgi:PTS system fructose-specific IIA component